MSRVTLLNNDHATVWYYPEKGIIHHEIKKYVYGNQLREILDLGCEEFKKNRAHKWLSDDRKNGPLNTDDTDWSYNDWLPRVVAAGWKYWAIVMPEKLLGKMNMQKHAENNAKHGITVQIFSDPDEAMKWLENQ